MQRLVHLQTGQAEDVNEEPRHLIQALRFARMYDRMPPPCDTNGPCNQETKTPMLPPPPPPPLLSDPLEPPEPHEQGRHRYIRRRKSQLPPTSRSPQIPPVQLESCSSVPIQPTPCLVPSTRCASPQVLPVPRQRTHAPDHAVLCAPIPGQVSERPEQMPSPFESFSTRAFTYYVWLYLNTTTEHAIQQATTLSLSNVPAFSIPTLSLILAQRAESIVREKHRKRSPHTPVTPTVVQEKVHELIHKALRSLVRLGRVVQHGVTYQVACPYLVACHLAIMLRVVVPPSRSTRWTSLVRKRIRTASLQHHLLQADGRFTNVPRSTVEAALHMMEARGLIRATDSCHAVIYQAAALTDMRAWTR